MFFVMYGYLFEISHDSKCLIKIYSFEISNDKFETVISNNIKDKLFKINRNEKLNVIESNLYIFKTCYKF